MKRIVLNFLLVMIAFYGSCQKIIVSNFEQQEASIVLPVFRQGVKLK